MEHYDLTILNKILDNMPLTQRREWLIKILMARERFTFQEIASKNRMTVQYLAGAVSGLFPWRRRIVEALEQAFKVELTAWLMEEEARKLGAKIV